MGFEPICDSTVARLILSKTRYCALECVQYVSTIPPLPHTHCVFSFNLTRPSGFRCVVMSRMLYTMPRITIPW